MEHAECTINLRRHAGTYEDSMATSIAIQATMPALIEAVQITLSRVHINVTEDIVRIDPLIDGSGESGVFITGYGVYGFIDGPLSTIKDKPRSLSIPRICGNCGTDDRNQSGRCNRCTGAQVKAWKLANPELAKEDATAWKSERLKAWKVENKDKNDAINKRWRDANPDKLRANAKAWAVANPDKQKAATAKFRTKNPERVKEAAKAWREANADLVKGYQKKANAKRSGGAELKARRNAWYARNKDRLAAKRKAAKGVQ
jgi:hypothetical protein